jgi:hypothetical protein
MKHIRQINSVGTSAYTIVITADYTDEQLPTHPAIVEHPELFEIADDSEIPPYHQFLVYGL